MKIVFLLKEVLKQVSVRPLLTDYDSFCVRVSNMLYDNPDYHHIALTE